MPSEDLLKSWAETERLLEQARRELGEDEGFAENVAEYQDYLGHNELELAMEALADLPDPARASPMFWEALRDAAANMGLQDRQGELHQRFLQADHRFRDKNLAAKDREAFDPDGSLRDIYIKGTDVEDWQRLIDHLTQSYKTEFVWLPDQITPPPPVAEIFATRSDRAATLRVDISGLRVNTHFFIEDEIELDLDPQEIRGQADVDAVLSFLTELGDLLHREVALTPENAEDVHIYRYRPGMGPPEYIPPPYPSA